MRTRRVRVALLVALAYLLNATYCPCSSAVAEAAAEQHQCCPPEKDSTKHSTDTHSHADGCQHCSLSALTSSSGESAKSTALFTTVDALHVVAEDLRATRQIVGHRLHGPAPPPLLPPLVRNARLQI